MPTLQRYLGRFTLPNDALDFTIGGNAVTLTSARYLMSGYAAEPTNQLCEHIQAKVRALGGNPYPAFTCTQSTTTGKITLSGMGAPTAIVWTDTALRDLLGFTAGLSGAATYTGTNQARYCWFPTRGLSEYPGDLTKWWTQRSTSYPYRSAGGQTYGVQGTLLDEGKYGYRHLPKADVITTSATVWESLQQFFADVIHPCEKIRVFPDRTLNSGPDYVDAVWGVEGENPIGSFTEFASRHIRYYNGLWSVDFQMWEFVS